MAFYYFFNSGANNFPAAEQMPSYVSGFTPVYSNTSDILNNPFYGWSLHPSDLYSQNEAFVSLGNSMGAQEIQNPTTSSIQGAPKKRRAQKSLEKEIISAKKNSQSNLINQFYSFFGSREKSERTVAKCCLWLKKTPCEVEKILPLFYMAVRYINAKRGRKYVNAAMLIKFFTPEEFGAYLPEFREKVDDSDFVTLPELCEIFRRCTTYFLKNVSVSAILTSKRISIISKKEHLNKRRKILRSVLEN